jgi:penicillin-binding protein 1A
LRRSRQNTNAAFRRFWLIVFSIFAAFLTIFLTITGIGGYASYRFYTSTQAQFAPKITTLHDLLPQDNLKMYDSKGIQLMQLTDQGMHTFVPLSQIASTLINATVATEDKNFWTNPGVDVLRIAQAALADLQHGRIVEGGSTITQQLIKNLVVGNETNVIRKLQEVVLTPEVNDHYSKSDIMEMYLNSIYYGEQAYGIDAAATAYFGLSDQLGKPASSQLDIAQSAMLAGIPSSPTMYDPRIHKQAALQRFQIVLDLMMRQGYITQTQALAATQEANKSDFLKAPVMENRAPHFTEFVLRQLQQEFHKTRADLSLSGMSVYTTLDINLQDKVQKIMQEHISELSAAHHMSNAAEVIIDFHTGAIKSLLGSIDYNSTAIDGKFDVATQGFRQPGSSFKPYVYATAMKQGTSPAQAILDEPITIKIPDSIPPTYSPVNYDHQFHGHMTIRCALQNSLNIPAVKTLEHVGIQNAIQTATQMGIVHTQGQPGYSMVLGGLDVNLLEHTSAYGTFADGGVHVPAYSIDKIVMANTQQTYGHPANPGTRALSPQIAYMMTDVLSDNQSRYMEFGPCSALLLYSTTMNQCYAGDTGAVRPAAAKTGTTNDFVDNWTMGYTTDYVMGVWAGNNDHSPMVNITGVDGAAPIWHDSMLAAEEGQPIRSFQNPGGLERKSITYPDGVHTADLFLPGTYPKFNKQVHATPTPPDGIFNLNSDNNNNDNNNDNNNQQTAPVTTRPYCTTYSYAFNPSPGKASLNGSWW